MKLIKQYWEWENKPVDALARTERAGRTCYKSESKGNPEKFVKNIIKRGHLSVIEHVSASVKLITNRGVTHELVRHRLASYSQESTRYVRYDGDMEFIRPVWLDKSSDQTMQDFGTACRHTELYYINLLKYGWTPEQAREILPNSLKTEIVMTANFRNWLHVFNLRCSLKAHPQIRALMLSVQEGFAQEWPVIFA